MSELEFLRMAIAAKQGATNVEKDRESWGVAS